MAKDFLKALDKKFLVFDGATGTMLQRAGLKPGACPDGLNLTDPALVKKVHRAFVEAGSDVVTTNTFGSSRPKLKEYGLEGKVEAINVAGVKNVREAAGGKVFVAGDVGPTGRFVEPVGDMTFDEAVEIFTEQTAALKKGGADLIIIETMLDLKELKAAIIAARATGLPVAATMTFDESMRSVLGTPPEVFAVTAASLGAVMVGANCSLGMEGILKAVTAMSRVTALPLIAQPNAGMPVLRGVETLFPATPEDMAKFVTRLVGAGVRALGGCCGTTPEHIRAIGSELHNLTPDTTRPVQAQTALSSRTDLTLFGGKEPPIIIGERINPTGRKALAREVEDGKTSIIREDARAQASAGADLLDVNMGVPGIDEARAITKGIFSVNENCPLPVVIDSADPRAVEAGLKAVDGKPLINSVSGEEKKLASILPLAKKYGAAVLCLTLDDAGIPDTAEGRVEVAKKILDRALALGIKRENLVMDCLAMAVSADPASAVETLRTIRLVKEQLGLTTVLGVSNVSFGLPARVNINSHFLSMAFSAGLDSAIVNPLNERVMDAYHASLVLIDRDPRAGKYIKRFGGDAKAPAKKTPAKKEKPDDIFSRLAKAVIEGDEENIVALVEEALAEKIDPLKISEQGLIAGLDEVGKLFKSNQYFLPQVILSADTMKKGFERVKLAMHGKKGPKRGKVLMATVEGDIHDIGKNIVTTLLENYGFDVIDLGKNVSADRVVEAARKEGADVVALSALMTTTVMQMEKVIKKLKAGGVKARTVVGGAVVTEEFAQRIGADEYGGEAVEAVEKIRRLVGEKKE